MNIGYPCWVWADPNALRVKLADNVFVDYIRVAGVWRQQTTPMTDKESSWPSSHLLHDPAVQSGEWTPVEGDLAAWLDQAYKEAHR